MKIAFFTDTFSPQLNGVTNTLNQLSRYLCHRGIGHIFFAPDYETDAIESEGEPAVTVPVHRFRGIRPVIYPQCRLAFPPVAKVTELLRDFGPDLVHIVTEQGIGYSGLKAAQVLGIPVVMSYHTSYGKYLDYYGIGALRRAVWSYVRLFQNSAELNLCPSENTRRELVLHGIGNLDIWTRGIDLKRFGPAKYAGQVRDALGAGDRTVFLYVGRIAREKGLDVLAESIRRLRAAERDKMLFVFTGDGPYLPALKALHIPHAVFTGPQTGEKLAQLYASSDVFVFPSGSETFGNVMLEAMASGLPGICTDAGGVTDFTIHGENACVFRNGDPDSLAGALGLMLDLEFRAKLRAGGLKTAKARSWETVFGGLLAKYDGVLQVRRAERKIAV